MVRGGAFWFLSGDTDEANLRARGVDIWVEWSALTHAESGREAGDHGPVYLTLALVRADPERDGVINCAAVCEIETNPNSRLLLVRLGPPRLRRGDLRRPHSFQFKVESGQTLHCQLYHARRLFPRRSLQHHLLPLLTHISRTPRSGMGEFIYTLVAYHITRTPRAGEELLSREPLPPPRLEMTTRAGAYADSTAFSRDYGTVRASATRTEIAAPSRLPRGRLASHLHPFMHSSASSRLIGTTAIAGADAAVALPAISILQERTTGNVCVRAAHLGVAEEPCRRLTWC